MSAQKKSPAKKASKKGGRGPRTEPLSPKASVAAKRAADLIWGLDATPHRLIQEIHELLLLRCLKEANGNYALAAAVFGPSRQSVQQYANNPNRDVRWRPYQQNRPKSQGA